MMNRIGVVFTGGEGPPPEIAGALVPPGALIVAADAGLAAAEAAGLSPRWIIGDMDSLESPERLETYPPERVLRFNRDKDESDTELALSLLWEKNCGETWLFGGGGGRTDHLFAIRALFERERSPARWLTASEDIRCIEPGGEMEARSLRKGSLVSVFPLGPGPWAAESEGLLWPLAGLPWDRGSAGLSNRTETGSFRFRALEGRFMVILPLIP